MVDISSVLADELGVRRWQVEAVRGLLAEGCTIPFIARYRKEATGGLDDATLRELGERLAYLEALEARKAEVLRAIDEQGRLTDELRARIGEAQVLQRVEDLYKPFKKKRATRASRAREAGLGPLASLILAQGRGSAADPAAEAARYVNAAAGYATAAAALQGARDIAAEAIAEDADNVADLRAFTRATGSLEARAADESAHEGYEAYCDFSEGIGRVPGHRVLAVNRGEREGRLRVRVRVDADAAVERLGRRVIRRGSAAPQLEEAVADGYKRLIAPSLEREMRAEATARAEADAIRVFARNVEGLLRQRPVRGVRVIALDPGYRTGCKAAVIDEYGNLLDYGTVFPTPPRRDVEGTRRALAAWARRYDVDVIAIGNGTASRETEEAVADFIEGFDRPLRYTIVNEAGASVYSASALAGEEYPDLDVTTRGALSLGRRLQDPLAELVKIPPQSIGVGQYQHDLDQAELGRVLAGVVERVVNEVGVDLNTASASLLSYVAGVSEAVARNIVAYRDEHGPFRSRRELKDVPRLGPKAFQNCAGFLRVAGGGEPLDATGVHPESYEAARAVLRRAGVGPAALAGGGAAGLAGRVGDVGALAAELGVGEPTLRDIIAELEKPGRDPRDDAPPVVFSRTVRDMGDLAPGMELSGTVRNVVDFGAFVDIGVKQDGLVHVSKMADRFVRHPSEVVTVGDTVTVWVTAVDAQRGRISLSMVRDKA
ncbi:RNA-binding transcriptional accessory protein [Adlercreutzia sp. JBNU-10]|uniref:RNA-binding transcriptional accessory protein n=1 Tax=Adlercreutzia faecimuris TaxID=2897341 RepID=A0ABS9WFS5_9ACTN|nr:Tex family protein [Adlercreutzia sp. JBNU-10]MCI2241425.1 RNA-binding transcriptional accessory protein [Adlercreutzia sp. JBNU-10]